MEIETRLSHTHKFLAAVGVGPWPANVTAWLALSVNEYGEYPPSEDHPQAEWNLWDTTEPGFGGVPFNEAGVQNYPNQSSGIAATVATLTNGRYDAALDLMRKAEGQKAVSGAVAILAALQAGGWGSINTGLAQQVMNAWSLYGNLPVSGATVETPTTPVEDEMKALLVKNTNGAGFVVAADLSHKVGVIDGADFAALEASNNYQVVTLTDPMLDKIPTVVE